MKQNEFFNLSVPLFGKFFKFCSILLFNVLGTLPGQLFSWTRCLTLVYRIIATLLGNLFLGACLGTCSGSLFLGTCSWEHGLIITCSWELFLGNLFLETLPAYFKPVHWDIAREPVFRNFACEPCLGTCPSEPCLGFCSCFQPCLQLSFEILLRKLFLESCSWEHEQPVLGNLAWEPVR